MGNGELDYLAILRALERVGYDGWLIAESEFGADWRGSTELGVTARIQYDGLTTLLG
ncbi:hypothetical protein [Nonomuraea sp. B5E05]|uniref:hypothetical protein n=1 Tax=Nonomuraea sp. B5E05 TaxID=3153569 RepID=UPI0032602660